jgi:hypothetical protein
MMALGIWPTLSGAGVWTIDPKLSVEGSYGTNPQLLLSHTQPEYDAAVLAELPTTYTYNSDSFALLPRVRLGDAHTYASYNSNYWYLDAVWSMNHERVQASLTAGASADSTLQSGLQGLQIGAPNTRRDGREAAATWQYATTERSAVSFNANWTRALFEPSSGVESFDYYTAGISYQYSLTERLTVNGGVSAGYYRVLTGLTTGETISVPLGVKYQLNPIWNLSLSVGGSRQRNEYIEQIEIPLVPPVTIQHTITQNSTVPVYSLSLQRNGERSSLSLTADRSAQPTGFGNLAQQEDATLSGSYQPAERWLTSLSARWLRARDPYSNGTYDVRMRVDAEADVVWHWRPVWDITVRAVHSNFRYQYLLTDEATQSTGIYVRLTRVFGTRGLW